MNDAEVAVPTEQDRQRRVADVGGAGEGRPGDLEDVVDEADDHERGERVEHDRRHDFMGARERLEGSRDEAVDRPAEGAGEDRDRHRDRGGLLRDRAADEAGDEPADEDLPGAADVEEARP